jgi:hypothetical protein
VIAPVIPRDLAKNPIPQANVGRQNALIATQTAAQAQRAQAQQAKVDAAKEADRKRQEAAQRKQQAILRPQQPDQLGPQAAATNQAALGTAAQTTTAVAALQGRLQQQQRAFDQMASRLRQITRGIQADQGTALNSGTQIG